MRKTAPNLAVSLEDNIYVAKEFATVEHVARIVSSVYGAKADYTRLAAELAQAISFDIFGIVLLQHDHKAVRVTVCQRDGNIQPETQQRWRAQYHQHPFTDSMVARLSATSALLVQEYPHGLDGPPAVSGDALSQYPQLHSTCIVPLRTEERILGTLELGSTVPALYTNPTVQRLISALAEVLATAIERTQLEGSAGIQDRQRQALKDVSRVLTSTMNLSTILAHIAESVANVLNVGTAIVTLDQRALHLAAQSRLDEARLSEVIQSELAMTDQCILGSTLRHRQSYISNDIKHDERFPASCTLASALSTRSVLTYPLIIGNTIYGILLLCSPEPGGFTPLKADIVALFATQVTLALHNGTLLEAVQQHNRFQNTIEQLEQTSLSPSYSQEEEYALLMHVRQEAQRTFGVSLSSLLRFVSDNVLNNTTHDIHMLLHEQRADAPSLNALVVSQRENTSSFTHENGKKHRASLQHTLSALTQTTQAVLARAGVVSELSSLLMQVQQPTNGVKDAWFVVDLGGFCVYMNPVAEAFCGVRMIDIENTRVTLEHIFAVLLLRIRNSDEVRSYLQNIMLDILYKQEVRGIVALEPLHPRSPATSQKAETYRQKSTQTGNGTSEQPRGDTSLLRTVFLENAPSDSHYQFMRYPLHNQQGQLTAYALQVRDITIQVRDERNKSALLSSVSHDLRTPLTTIKAAVTGLLQEDVPWDAQMRREMLEDIDTEADHLTVLVNALVEMSRIEMGALVLEKEWCDLTEILYETLIKAKRLVAGCKVQTQISSALPLLYIDHVQLGRVFYNLIENAARHSPEQSEILIKADAIAEEPTMVRVQVIDSGCGIPEHEHERIFKSFYGLRSHGSGLGLAICKGIIEAHQGHIWVESGEKGSCFIFTLPIDGTRATERA